MGNLYFIEKMMIERMREVKRQAEFRTRLGLRRSRAEPTPHCLRTRVGGWLIRAGFRLQGSGPDPGGALGPIMGGAGGAPARQRGQNGHTPDSG